MDHPFLQMLLLAVLLAAMVTDLWAFRIPNWLTFPAMGCGLVGHTVLGGLAGLVMSLQGLGLGLALFLMFYLMGGMGAGDVKLLAAVGALVGPEQVFIAGLLAAALGGLYAVALLLTHWGGRLSAIRLLTLASVAVRTRNLQASLTPSAAEPRLRYGLVIVLGTILSQWYLEVWLVQ